MSAPCCEVIEPGFVSLFWFDSYRKVCWASVIPSFTRFPSPRLAVPRLQRAVLNPIRLNVSTGIDTEIGYDLDVLKYCECKVIEIVAEDLAPKKSYSDLVETARDDQV